jgi:hypothetical protein
MLNHNKSIEQEKIIEEVGKGYNIMVDAVAGSGKSTTILLIAKAYPNKKFLQITYNSMLRYEVKEKVKKSEMTNIEIQTYHSLAVKHYSSNCHTDTGIRKLFFNNTKIHTLPKPYYDIIVIDEAQDMTPLYYKLILKFIEELSFPVQMLFFGDKRQSLYEFKGADHRFLSFADKIWENKPILKTSTFVKCSLKTSYRITNQMASFINNVMIDEEIILACKDGEPVQYIRNTRKHIETIVINKILKLLSNGASPNDIFVLGGSVKGSTSNIRKMENKLVEHNIPCHVPTLENEKMDERVINGKVVFSTFHSVKGRQRKYVFIVGFDNTYTSHFAKNLDPKLLPNTLYVGTTRATDNLFLLENNQYNTDRPLEFLKMTHHEMIKQPYIHFTGQPQLIFYKKENEYVKQKIQKHYITPSEIIKFIPENVLEEITPLLDRIFKDISKEKSQIEIPTVIETEHGLFEDVSDLNGIAIPSIYYDYWNQNEKKENILHKIIVNSLNDTKDGEYNYLKKIIYKLPEDCAETRDYLYLANVYMASQEKLYYKLKQINNYDWLEEEAVEKCIERLNDVVGNDCIEQSPIFEHTIIHSFMDDEHVEIDKLLKHFFNKDIFRITARLDLITDNTVWELKCCTQITLEHMIQVVFYAWIWRVMNYEDKEFKLFNIKTGDCLLLEASIEELTTIIVALLKGKYDKTEMKTDKEFISDFL